MLYPCTCIWFPYEIWLSLRIDSQGLEKLADEQDKETDKVAILREVEICKKQLERYDFQTSNKSLNEAHINVKKNMKAVFGASKLGFW